MPKKNLGDDFAPKNLDGFKISEREIFLGLKGKKSKEDLEFLHLPP